ncbi:hypothetical protein JAAARDRAFT_37198 [Jaapia argillacea MUCL 33604]|uniref:CUE domain-containing protein n=1 Tax=Jaapia argillacea MUCL 33604 TaxID=933084 RepID=A0A067PLS2_9AGAM|nr:hypothetical protein JAAARDRAFT_37198 [Jaapia argillacea MUCL 33604]
MNTDPSQSPNMPANDGPPPTHEGPPNPWAEGTGTSPAYPALTTSPSPAVHTPPPTASIRPAGSTSPPPAIGYSATPDAPVPSLPPRDQGVAAQEEPLNPQVASLQAIFPDFDPVILQSVLESVDWDQDRAVDALLGMSDPDFVSQPPAAPTQTDLDEQLARRLALEEDEQQQRHQQRQQNRQSWRAQDQRGYQSSVPYQARNYQTQQPQQPGMGYEGPGGAGNRDSMAEFQQQFNRIAETGKKTFSSIVSKVKAKMQEYDQPPARTGQGSGTTPNWGGQAWPVQEQQQTQPAYYDPNVYQAPSSPPRQPTQGYNVSPPPGGSPNRPSPLPSPSASDAAPSNPFNAQAANAPRTSYDPPPRASADVSAPRPPPTQSGPPPAGIDPTKIGLLPKRPVSLLRDQPSQSRPIHDDDDELEYVENPFEEGRR